MMRRLARAALLAHIRMRGPLRSAHAREFIIRPRPTIPGVGFTARRTAVECVQQNVRFVAFPQICCLKQQGLPRQGSFRLSTQCCIFVRSACGGQPPTGALTPSLRRSGSLRSFALRHLRSFLLRRGMFFPLDGTPRSGQSGRTCSAAGRC
jgi:hypothetical protein